MIDGEPLTLIDIHADQQGAVLHTASRTWSRAQMEAKRPVVVEPHRPHGAFIALTGEALCGADMETWDLDDALEELNEGG